MKKWYKELYFDKRTWILENIEKLNLTCEETLTVLLIDYARQANILVNNKFLGTKLQKTSEQIDNIVSSLVSKGYLNIKVENGNVNFDIDGLFDEDLAKLEEIDNKDIYEIYSDLIGKPATTSEMMKINDLLNEYGENKVIDAFRMAEAYRKCNLNYIESILKNEEK